MQSLTFEVVVTTEDFAAGSAFLHHMQALIEEFGDRVALDVASAAPPTHPEERPAPQHAVMSMTAVAESEEYPVDDPTVGALEEDG